MASLTLQLLHLLLMVSAAVSYSNKYKYRYLGGSLTFTPKGKNSDGTWEVEIRNKQTTYYCNLNYYTCSSGHCGSQVKFRYAQTSSYTYALQWCEYEVVTRRKLKDDLPFEIRYPTRTSTHYGQGYWIANVKNSFGKWSMMAHVDLGIRSDTGESNRSPITTMLPILRVISACPRSYNITVFDPDGDRIRCRVATRSSSSTGMYECGLCGQTTGFSLDQDSCLIRYSYTRQSGYNPIELVVEDYPKKEIKLTYHDGYYTLKRPFKTALPTTARQLYRPTIAPISKIPLQFTFNVESFKPSSCLDGDYFPIFLSPTPSNGVHLPAFVNHTLEIKVRSTALYATIFGLVVTGPKGFSKQKLSTEEYVIKWTPTQNELDDHFPFCFVSEARDKSLRVYQSELRCVIADVGYQDTTVTCNETTIMVEVQKSYLIKRNEGNLHLNDIKDPSCNLMTLSNRTHLVAVMSLNMCGTLVEEDDDNLVFKNEITSAEPNEIISRQHDVEIAFSCVYPKRTNLTLGFKHKNPYAFTEKGFSTFTFQFEFFESQLFRKQIDASTYPVEVNLKQMMFMQIEATTSIPNTELFVESCRATPYDNPKSRITYAIIENGCAMDKTVQIYPSSKSQFRFGMEAFEFIGAHEEVYITCSVILCESGVSGTRCSQGCIKSTSGNHRSKREAVGQTSSHSISQGPLHLIKTSPGSGLKLNLGMNLVFIVGCLLVCGVVIYHSRRSKAKYQPLPTSDAD